MTIAVEFAFNVERHEYSMSGKVVPGCTSVLASGGLVPYAMVSAEYLERRSELGREVHKACHLDNIGRLGSFDKAVGPHLEAWRFYKKHCRSCEILASEQQCIGYVNGMPYGMQIDTLALVDRYETMIELKIGEPYPHHGVQLAGQTAGFPHPKIQTPFARFIARKRIVVQLCEDGMPKVEPYDEKSDYEMFA